jgi:hypothetical protein
MEYLTTEGSAIRRQKRKRDGIGAMASSRPLAGLPSDCRGGSCPPNQGALSF